jgi:ribosomal-protein-alanine N-acetyltransferase
VDVLSLSTPRLLLPLFTADDVAAVVDGRRLSGWAEDFPAEGDRDIAGVLARTGIPVGPDAVFGPRLVVERDTGLAIGSVGFHGPPDDGRVEVGYGLVESRRGRGYATEAVATTVRLALDQPGVTEVVATVEVTNPASVRVLQKNGFRFRSRTGTEELYTLPAVVGGDRSPSAG